MEKAITLFFLFIGILSCNQKSENKHMDNPPEFVKETINYSQELKNFYIEYITACEKNSSATGLNSLRNKYLSKELLQKIREKNKDEDYFLDYDPITNAQDCFVEMLTDLEVKQDSINDKIYTITTYDPYSENGKKSITYLLVEENMTYKIDRILSDPNFK